ncbi:MAG: class I SAM-dependent methyltransferase [Betaproteobacteria bacterium]
MIVSLASIRPWLRRLKSGQRSDATRTTGAAAALPAEDGAIAFVCNLCGTPNTVAPAALSRETPSCHRCASTVRFRAVAHLVCTELLQHDATLTELPVRNDLRGIGLSDDDRYAHALAAHFNYTNTWFDASPQLDIMRLPESMAGQYDFLIASDVFEHVAPPVQIAFINARRLLKPGGVFIFTVPFSLDAESVEHFPELNEFHLEQRNGQWRLHNITRDGRAESFGNLVFHGGPGRTLEMRLFSQAALMEHFASAGFRSWRIASEPCAVHGIAWPEPWSVPIVAIA